MPFRGSRHRHSLARATPIGVDAPVATVNPLAATQEGYARNAFVSTALRHLERVHLRSLEDADLVQAWARTIRCDRCDDDDESLEGEHLKRHLRRWLLRNGAPVRIPAPRAPVARNLWVTAELLGLSRDEAAVLQFLVAAHHGDPLREVLHAAGDLTLADAVALVAAATRLPATRVAEALRSDGRLVSSGLVDVDADRGTLCAKLTLHAKLSDLLFALALDRDLFLRAFLEPAAAPSLVREDFADPDSVRAALDLLGAALRTGARGVNVLLHGPTGVGKSELARLLGQELGAPVFAVGRADARGDSATATERLASLRLAQQLAPRGASLLLFDELEDLFRWELDLLSASRAAAQMSKQWFGALLEENPIPTIWCTNRVDGVDPAFLRRFAYAIELSPAGARQRARVIARHAGDALPSAEADALARRFEASPAQLATAIRTARLVAGDTAPDRAGIERFLAPVHRLVTGESATPRPAFTAAGYRLDALCCDEDLEALAGRIASFRPDGGPGLSLCLYGPPGVGKSEFVKFLAWRRGAPLVQRRVSDLVSCYVGQTERNIARAFEEARHDGSVLVFDEADSFLRDRTGAVRSWEVTQVNEFLQQLEAFPGIVACTTNLWRDLDEAALRRFVFKLEFRYPSPAQALALFREFFPAAFAAAGEPAIAAALRDIPRLLAPGDFAAVARRVRALRMEDDVAGILRALAGEVALKRDAGTRPVGFVG